jgi:hypothetical protein
MRSVGIIAESQCSSTLMFVPVILICVTGLNQARLLVPLLHYIGSILNSLPPPPLGIIPSSPTPNPVFDALANTAIAHAQDSAQVPGAMSAAACSAGGVHFGVASQASLLVFPLTHPVLQLKSARELFWSAPPSASHFTFFPPTLPSPATPSPFPFMHLIMTF